MCARGKGIRDTKRLDVGQSPLASQKMLNHKQVPDAAEEPTGRKGPGPGEETSLVEAGGMAEDGGTLILRETPEPRQSS